MPTKTTLAIHIAPGELITVCNALNNVCNGVGLANEFETRMGTSLESARALLARLLAVLDAGDLVADQT